MLDLTVSILKSHKLNVPSPAHKISNFSTIHVRVMKSEDLLPLHGAFQTFFSFHLCHFLSLALSSCVIALYLHEALVCLGLVTDKNNHKYSTDLYIGK